MTTKNEIHETALKASELVNSVVTSGSLPPSAPEVAAEAMAKADAAELFAMYEEAIKDREALKMCIDVLSKHFIAKGGEGQPRYQRETDSAVSEMQTVALAAIDLAKSIHAK